MTDVKTHDEANAKGFDVIDLFATTVVPLCRASALSNASFAPCLSSVTNESCDDTVARTILGSLFHLALVHIPQLPSLS